ncbi:hypothetical protein CVT25_000815 [Psilocybe cyanescens]|uniref:Uncharacterized protein n=1 Tax=Psilocybe cyanescens TaxID=93625 RepID=A0A409XXM3_PSICY|nr:hypothetical protein CVT25_000815 [Psilocybe cyanescens]
MILSTIGAARVMRAWLPRRRWSLWGVCLWIPFATRCNGAVLLQLVRTRAAWTFSGSRMTAANRMAPPPTPSAEGDTGALRAGPYPEGTTPEHELFVDELAGASTGCGVPEVKESSGGSACLGSANYAGVATQYVRWGPDGRGFESRSNLVPFGEVVKVILSTLEPGDVNNS